jgi:hypothetical protein
MGWVSLVFCRADVAQSVEHSLGKGEVTGSIPVISSRVLISKSCSAAGVDDLAAAGRQEQEQRESRAREKQSCWRE